jgi:hypothetical protein
MAEAAVKALNDSSGELESQDAEIVRASARGFVSRWVVFLALALYCAGVWALLISGAAVGMAWVGRALSGT